MPRAGVGVTVSATKVELEAVALVGDEVGIAVGSLPLRKLGNAVSAVHVLQLK